MLKNCLSKSLASLVLIISPIGAKTAEEEKTFLESQEEKIKLGEEHQYTIFFGKKIVGGAGLKIERGKKYGDIGYFVGKKFQGKGIATKATKKLIKKAKELGLIGVKATTHPFKIGSQKVLERTGFKRVGYMEKYMLIKEELQPRLFYWLLLKE